MKFLRQLLLPAVAVALVVVSMAPPAMAAGAKRATVRVSTAKMRSGPSEDRRAVGLLDHGDSFPVVGRSGQWVKIRLESGKSGWVRADLIRMSVVKASSKPKSTPRPTSEAKKVSGPNAASQRTVVTNSVKTAKASASESKQTTPTPLKSLAKATAPAPANPSRLGDEVPDSVRISQGLGVVPATPESPSTETADVLPVINDVDVALEAPVDRIGRARASLVEDALSVYRQSNEVNRSSSSRTALVSRAKSLRGTPYRFGSTGRGAFDCSGFTQHLYRRQGVSIPRTAAEQFHHGSAVGRMSLRQGDLVFFRNTGGRRGISHVGLFLGSGRFIHASSRGGGVRIDSLTESYYASHFAGARRVLR
jgi:cell wall-associated NlpC family hydrolase